MICPNCRQLVPEELREARKLLRGKKISEGLRRAKESGTRIGRPIIRDDKAIRRLRVEGLSMQKIALKLGLSTATVFNSLKLEALSAGAGTGEKA